jgi:hypothetical protein
VAVAVGTSNKTNDPIRAPSRPPSPRGGDRAAQLPDQVPLGHDRNRERVPEGVKHHPQDRVVERPVAERADVDEQIA